MQEQEGFCPEVGAPDPREAERTPLGLLLAGGQLLHLLIYLKPLEQEECGLA